MRGNRQGMIINGYHDDYGVSVPLYDYSGLGVDLGFGGDLVEKAGGMVDELPAWAKVLGLVAAGAGVYALATGKVKLMGAAKRTNGRKRRSKTSSRASAPRTNRKRRSTRARSRSRARR